MFTIEMLPANEGDTLWIEYGTNPVRRILVDCGRKTAYREVIGRLKQDPEIGFELFVLTHVDGDHIAGAVPLLGDPHFGPARVKDVWFNGWCHLNRQTHDFGGDIPILSAKEGEYFGALLHEREFPWNEAFDRKAAVIDDTGSLPYFDLDGGMKLTLLGPNWEKLDDMRDRWKSELSGPGPAPGDEEAFLELLADDKGHLPDVLSGGPLDIEELQTVPFDADKSEPNGSSISLLAEYDGKTVLLAGDAHAPQLASSIQRLLAARGQSTLKLDALKMAHHGSARNNSSELLELLDCRRYLISTNGTKHHHPDPEALARVLALYDRDVEFCFNYRTNETEPWGDEDLQQRYGYNARFLVGGPKIEI